MVSKLGIARRAERIVFHQDIYNKATGKTVINGVASVVCVEDGQLSRGEKLAEAFKPYLK